MLGRVSDYLHSYLYPLTSLKQPPCLPRHLSVFVARTAEAPTAFLAVELSQAVHRINLTNAWGPAIGPSTRVNELGCGQGTCTQALAEAVSSHGDEPTGPGSGLRRPIHARRSPRRNPISLRDRLARRCLSTVQTLLNSSPPNPIQNGMWPCWRTASGISSRPTRSGRSSQR